jgi:hypothetical protein
MRAEDLRLVGLDTKEEISLGPGFRDWSVMDFRGPVFSAKRVGGPIGRIRLLLPKDLLVAVYDRFAKANPTGCAVADVDEMHELIYAPDIPEAERERLWDSGEVGWDVFDWRIPPHGRDPILRYLPELFDPAVLQGILDDPRLGQDERPPNAPKNFEDWWLDRRRHYRWSDWWNTR